MAGGRKWPSARLVSQRHTRRAPLPRARWARKWALVVAWPLLFQALVRPAPVRLSWQLAGQLERPRRWLAAARRPNNWPTNHAPPPPPPEFVGPICRPVGRLSRPTNETSHDNADRRSRPGVMIGRWRAGERVTTKRAAINQHRRAARGGTTFWKLVTRRIPAARGLFNSPRPTIKFSQNRRQHQLVTRAADWLFAPR